MPFTITGGGTVFVTTKPIPSSPTIKSEHAKPGTGKQFSATKLYGLIPKYHKVPTTIKTTRTAQPYVERNSNEACPLLPIFCLTTSKAYKTNYSQDSLFPQ